MVDKITTQIEITSDNVFIEGILGHIYAENYNDPKGCDTSLYKVCILPTNNKASSVIKGDTCDGHSYKRIYFTDVDGKEIKKLILHIE